MSFLAPLFLIGALAVAAPVIFHLIRRTTREKTPFSSLMFLMPSPPRLTRRSRLEHLLLLALRCLVLLLLAAGFARPLWKKSTASEPASDASRSMVILVDSSASMRREGIWAEACDRARSVLNKTSPADQVSLFTFDSQVSPVLSVEQWRAAGPGERATLAAGALAQRSPGWGATHLGNALVRAAETLLETSRQPTIGPKQIVLISDMQEGSRLDQLQGYEWPNGIELAVEQVKPKHASNAGLQLITETDETDSKTAGAIRVRVSNAADSKLQQFKVGWARPGVLGFATNALDVYVPAGQSRIVQLPTIEGSQVLRQVILQGDEESFDNSVYVLPPRQNTLTVLYAGNETETDPHQPLYFIQRAFHQTAREKVQVKRGLDSPQDLQSAALLIVNGSLADARAATVNVQVKSGKTLLFLLKDAAAAATLARLVGADAISAEEAHVGNYALLSEIDFRHPLFAPFADPRFSDFTRIHFWKYRRLEAGAIPGGRAIAKFDSGDPAIIEAAVGKGRVLILTSGWQPDDSQLALSTKFVPLLYALLDSSGDATPLPTQYFVGDTVPIGVSGQNLAEITLRQPDGAELHLSSGETNFSRTTMPGIFEIKTGTADSGPAFAVNLDPAESRTAPLPVDELERLGAPIAHQAQPASREVGRKVQLQNAELENRQKLWRWFIVATIAVLLFETWLAGRTARNLAPAEAV